MTRLKPGDIETISIQLTAYDNELLHKTGHTLRGIACHAQGIDEQKILHELNTINIGIVPILSGQGIIPGFCETISHIVQHIGLNAFVTGNTDVSGIAEAVENGAKIIMMADDKSFVALNVTNGLIVDNAEATGKGFVAGLDLISGGLNGQKVLVIGCGPVGQSATLAAIRSGAEVFVFDIDLYRSQELARTIKECTGSHVNIEENLEQALSNSRLLIEATNGAGIIDESHITPRTYITAPGMPLGLTPAAVQKVSQRLIHDPLQLGVAVMTIESAIL
ncbi:MAG: 3-methylornithyl-N6-L-lysine dehydrogenase PylD [Acidobacteria bacterium]|jgi:pyrrolysine biosynthesis protein PylD|nr:3-methylornithyl-N6-L-lysine dehydrogenase PylD [Acidobacteriota bacterium]